MASRNSFSGPSRTIIENNNILNRIRSSNGRNRNHNLEELIDVNIDLEIYRNQQINLLNPRTLYRTG